MPAISPEQRSRREQARDRVGAAAGIAGERDLRQAVGDRDADLRVRRMQVGFGHAHIGALAHEVGRQAERQLSREAERSAARNAAGRPSLGKAPGQRREQIALLGELFLQRRQQQPRLRHRRLLRHHVGQRDLAAVVLPPQDVEQLRLDIDQPPRRRDLAAQRRLLDRGKRDVGGEREVDGLALERLRLGLRFGDFDLRAACRRTRPARTRR